MSFRLPRTSRVGLPSMTGSEKAWPMFNRILPAGKHSLCQFCSPSVPVMPTGRNSCLRLEGQPFDARHRLTHRAWTACAFGKQRYDLAATQHVQHPAVGAGVPRTPGAVGKPPSCGRTSCPRELRRACASQRTTGALATGLREKRGPRNSGGCTPRSADPPAERSPAPVTSQSAKARSVPRCIVEHSEYTQLTGSPPTAPSQAPLRRPRPSRRSRR